MKRAIELARKGSGFVNPGPLSGAVIVKDNKIIGEGYYSIYKGESAELKAIRNCTEHMDGSELYLNIVPTRSSGSYKSSIEAIISSGIKQVHIGLQIENEKCENKAVTTFKEYGIEVEVGLLKDECEELNEIYCHYVKYGTPFVFTKWAMTLDGKLATKTGDSKWISGNESLEFVHNLRQRTAAIMVGENTVRLDNPMLTTRLKGVEISNPLRVILSKYGNINDDANVLKVDKNTKTLIIASEHISNIREEALVAKGVEVLKLQEHERKIDFRDIVEALGKKGIDSLYIEGGSGVLGAAFESRIVNKVYATVAPKIIGGEDAFTPVGGRGIEKMMDAIMLQKVSYEIVGRDVIITGYI